MCVSEDFDFYSLEIQLNSDDALRNEQLNSAKSFFASIISKGFNAQITFTLNDDIEYNGIDISQLLDSIDSIGDINSDDLAIVKISHEKDCSKTLYIFNSSVFVSFLNRFSIEDQIKLINDKLFDNYQSINVDNNYFHIGAFQQSLYYKESLFSEINDIYLKIYSSKLSPLYVSYILDNITTGCEFNHYLKKLLVIMCLSLISNDFDFQKNLFIFDSDREISIDDIEIQDSFTSSVYHVFLWIFSDDRYITRKSVFNSVISLQSNIFYAFNERLIGTLSSNLKILYKNNFENYLEARNGVLDFIFELSVKMNDMINQKLSSSKNVFFVLISYFFTTFVFTGIDKGKINNMFNVDVTALSLIFIISSMIFIVFNQLDIEKNINFHLSQRDEFKKRYESIFSEKELDDMFNSDSLNQVVANSRSRKYLYVYQVILFAMFSTVVYLYSLK
ncbi:hypothetical protein PTW35_26145 (plasmid) [Photobacterium sp. DA100]|uniref:hypothetical protein n=1 Tax=Photobacterium sp. DA100 TaxID=3027472 RepID=UPI00247AA2EB|nr:hypothetical protein [Photobacterium sp. DA100]WEM44738.1 hypothetical protein PTW35_26145 [Photobacterium sp. DA100]